MKTDEQLRKDVMAELDWDPSTHATQVGVAVKDGVAASAPGSTSVISEIRVES